MQRLAHIFLRLADACNLECVHCYASCGPRAVDRIPLDTVIRFIQQLEGRPIRDVHLEGGEALIYRGIDEVIDTLNDVGHPPSITSNGLVVGEETIASLRGRVKRLAFSVDGHCADVHDQIRRRRGSFERVVRAIRLSKQAGITTNMISVIWSRSVEHVAEIVALAEDLEVDRLLLFSCGRIGAAVEHWEELACSDEAWQSYLDRVSEIARSRPWLWFEVDRVRREDLRRFVGPDYKPVCMRRPIDSITVDPRGNVYPCGYFIPYGKSLGSIQESSLNEILAQPSPGERFSGACRNPWSVGDGGTVELCKIYSVNADLLSRLS